MRKIKILNYFICFTTTIFCQNTPLTQQKLKKQNIYCFTLFNADTNSIDQSKVNFTDVLSPSDFTVTYSKKYDKLYDSFRSDFKLNVPHNKIFRIRYDATICDTFPINSFNYPNLQELCIISYREFYFPNELSKFKNLENLELLLSEGQIDSDLRLTHFLVQLQKIKSLKQLTITSEEGGFEYIPETFFDSLHVEVFNYNVENYQMINFPLSVFFNENIKEINFAEKQKIAVEENFYNEVNSFILFDYDLPMLCNEYKNLMKSIKVNDSFWNKSQNAKNINLARKILDIDSNQFIIHRKNNQILCQGGLSNDKLNGKCTLYYASGKLKEERFYSMGKETGVWKFYDTLGINRAVFDFTDSTEHFTYYLANGKVKADITTRNGIPDAVWTLYNDDGTVYIEKKYENGIRTYNTSYTPYAGPLNVKNTLLFNRKSKIYTRNFYDNTGKVREFDLMR
jgi:antitoxin component YwqK of YwqJK toxin-antitoxin module